MQKNAVLRKRLKRKNNNSRDNMISGVPIMVFQFHLKIIANQDRVRKMKDLSCSV